MIAGCQGPMGTSRRPRSLNLGIYLIRVPSEWPRKRVTPKRNLLEQKGELGDDNPLCRLELGFIPQSLAEIYLIRL